MADTILEATGLSAGYGRRDLVLKDVSFSVRPYEVVCLVGPNGAGKSTILKVLSGLLQPKEGTVFVKGKDATGLSPYKLLSRGVAHVLQGHSVFPEMTVAENVRLGGYTMKDQEFLRERITRVRELFPVVDERWKDMAGLLSGGQQKMIELARAMVLDPDVILLDEPSCGLEPRSQKIVFDEIKRLRDLGKAMLLVEQNVRSALSMADRGYVLDLGRIRMEGPGAELLDDPELVSVYFGGSVSSSNTEKPDV